MENLSFIDTGLKGSVRQYSMCLMDNVGFECFD